MPPPATAACTRQLSPVAAAQPLRAVSNEMRGERADGTVGEQPLHGAERFRVLPVVHRVQHDAGAPRRRAHRGVVVPATWSAASRRARARRRRPRQRSAARAAPAASRCRRSRGARAAAARRRRRRCARRGAALPPARAVPGRDRQPRRCRKSSALTPPRQVPVGGDVAEADDGACRGGSAVIDDSCPRAPPRQRPRRGSRRRRAPRSPSG